MVSGYKDFIFAVNFDVIKATLEDENVEELFLEAVQKVCICNLNPCQKGVIV